MGTEVKLLNGSAQRETKEILERKHFNNLLVNELENKITKSQEELFKINKIIENAIHWCLVNGTYCL